MKRFCEQLGRRTVVSLEELGYVASLCLESVLWLFLGPRRRQPVQTSAVFREAMEIGVMAIPIVSMLCFAVGVMLAIQGIETLKVFGAESKVVIGIALSVTREFSPLIVAILVAGRSGSAIAARIGTMHESQEIDALRVIGINPIRYLSTPLLLAALISVPSLTVLGDLAGLFGGALFTSLKLNVPVTVFFQRCLDILSVDDIGQGLIKSIIFSLIIVLIGVSNGFQVRGGAEGVGRATTRSVVLSITFIILADLIFTFFMNR
ncbi:MAG: ABC transporter permease [Desulfobulbaceae bacterium]|nr:ABC transporter permease [Desulfobulbaceae bacterium]